MKDIRTEEDLEAGLEILLLKNPDLVPIAEQARPLVLHVREPGFAGLARVIIAQQVSMESAAAVYSRFARLVKPLTPVGFLDAGEETWIKIGLTRPKQNALNETCKALVSGHLDLGAIANMEIDAAIAALTTVKGIGPWTAEVYLLMCLGNPDVFPATDLALREALRLAFNLEERPPEDEARALAAKWTPLRGIAANLFWSYYIANKEGRIEALSRG